MASNNFQLGLKSILSILKEKNFDVISEYARKKSLNLKSKLKFQPSHLSAHVYVCA